MEEDRKRHCWECLRRRLVCDFTRPACTRCSTAGTVCPGYNDAEPPRLRWLTPGRVVSRNRWRKGAPPGQVEDSREQLTTTCTRAELARRIKDVAIPRFQMRTEDCALAQAIGYCKWRPQETS